MSSANGLLSLPRILNAAHEAVPLFGANVNRQASGLPVPVDLFQVDAADLLADFPPPRSATPAE